MDISSSSSLKSILSLVEKPGRYTGGEFGEIIKTEYEITIALCFPDLYEIAMSNQAIRILYNALNAIDGVRCERVFAPGIDFEKALTENNIALYTLESGIPLCDVDIVAFSIGYELLLSNIITVLNSGKIEVKSANRKKGPVIIAGGPAISNPVPFSVFIDAIYIGEAEEKFYALIKSIIQEKKINTKESLRNIIMKHISLSESFWQKNKKTTRAIFSLFSETQAHTCFPVPSVKTIQDHGTVEIMRGCPNGCRFCHAGYYYRPQRMKSEQVIISEVEELVEKAGYLEITLTSLSSGDYTGIDILLKKLNNRFKGKHISFQLPSLKVSSFTLPVLEELSEVRKSGLTFAIETPLEAWQRIINKTVYFDKVLEILEQSKEFGWKLAKFYFMIGLPFTDSVEEEAKHIIDFLITIKNKSKMNINANVGVFVPKPHTPFQWARQARDEEAIKALETIKNSVKRYGINISFHSPFISQIEGLITRGDENAGNLVYDLWTRGARFDAWQEHFDRQLWRNVLELPEYANFIENTLCEHDDAYVFPWDTIDIGVTKGYLLNEKNRAMNKELTLGCAQKCTLPCGACSDSVEIVHKSIQDDVSLDPLVISQEILPFRKRLLITFSKTDNAMFLSHLNIVEIFLKAFERAHVPVQYSEGFNPQAHLEFASPLALGIEGMNEIALVGLEQSVKNTSIVSDLNTVLPKGLYIQSVFEIDWPYSKKQLSASSLYSASTWELHCELQSDAQKIAEYVKLSTPYSITNPHETIILITLPNIMEKASQPMTIIKSILETNEVSRCYVKRLNLLAKNNLGVSVSFEDALQSYI